MLIWGGKLIQPPEGIYFIFMTCELKGVKITRLNSLATSPSYRAFVYCAGCSLWSVNRGKRWWLNPNPQHSPFLSGVLKEALQSWQVKKHTPSKISPLRKSVLLGVVAALGACVLHVIYLFIISSHDNFKHYGSKTQRTTLINCRKCLHLQSL